MPGRDGTGPFGAGAMTGRGFGSCAGAGDLAKVSGLGFGPVMSCRRGFRRGVRRFFADGKITAENHRKVLQARKDALKNQIAVIDRQMESL